MTTLEKATKFYETIDKNKIFEDEMGIILAKRNDEYAETFTEDDYKRYAAYILVGRCSKGGGVNFNTRIENAIQKFFFVLPEKKNTSEKTADENKTSENGKCEADNKKEGQEKAIIDEEIITTEDGIEVVGKGASTFTKSEDNIKFNTKSSFINDEEDKTDIPKSAIFNYEKMMASFNGESSSRKINKTIEKRIEIVKNELTQLIPVGLTMSINPIITGLLEITLLKDNSCIANFKVDPNIIHGNGYYLIANSELGICAVPFKERELIQKALSGFTLSKDDVDICVKYIFVNSNIYTIIDMSGNKLNNIDNEEYKLFELNLRKLLAVLENEKLLGRYRIYRYKDSQNFNIISDDKVTCCLENSIRNITGISASLKNSNIVIIYNADKVVVKEVKL